MAERSCLDLSVEDQDEDTNWVDCSKELAITSFPNFNDLRQSGRLCDVSIDVDDGCVFRAHKVVLAATIPFFQVMFTTDMVESRSSTIKITQIDSETMESILNFVYTGRIKCSSENLEKILNAADYFQLSIISDRCADLLKSKINVLNVLGIRRFAACHNSPQTIAVADRFIQMNFVEISSTSPEFVELDRTTLLEVLSWDGLHVDSEEQIFDAAMKWLEHDLPTRRAHSPKVLAAVRMPLLKPNFLTTEVAMNSIVSASKECRTLVEEAKNFHSLLNSVKTTTRHCQDVPGIIYALGGFNPTAASRLENKASLVEMYDPLVGRWSLTRSMLTARSRVGVAVMDRKFYVIGGFDGINRLKTVEVFDSRTSTWSEMPSLREQKSAMCVAVCHGRIYVCGGYNGHTAINTVEYFDSKLNQWIADKPMESSRCAAAAAVVDGMIYVMGGHNGVTIFNSVERFDPKTGQWQKVAPLLTGRCRLSAVEYQGKIYAAGGYNETFLNTVEVYDPKANTWSQVASMNLKRARVSLVNTGSLIYVIGGYDGESNLRSIEVYNPAKDQWEFGAHMIAHEGGVGAAVIPASPKFLSHGDAPHPSLSLPSLRSPYGNYNHDNNKTFQNSPFI